MRTIAANSRRNNAYKRAWRNNANKVELFGKTMGKTMYSNSFTAAVMEEYIAWLQSQPKNYKTLTIRGFCSKLGEAIRKAAKTGYKVDYGFDSVEVPNEEPCTVALTEEEVMNVFNVKKLSKEAHSARERFVIACCTGLRHGDIKNLTTESVSGQTIKVTPHKTRKKGIRVELPVHWMVKAVLKRNGGKLPKIASDQSYNATIKRVCKRAGVESPVLYEQHHGTKLVRKNVPKYTMISSHTARRTLATNLYLQGVQPAKIMLLTGHTTEQSFFKYIRINRAENAKELSQHPFFVGKNATMAKERMPIGKQIAAKRKLAGLTQPQLAERLELGLDAIKSYETGRRLPSIEVLKKIAEVLECTLTISLD